MVKIMETWIKYHAFDPNPLQKKEECFYFDNRYNGKYTEWYNDGKLKTEGYYNKGKKVEKFIKFYENCKMKEEDYTNAVLSGKQTRWYDNGVTKEVAYFIDGKFIDHIVNWDENGIQVDNADRVWDRTIYTPE